MRRALAFPSPAKRGAGTAWRGRWGAKLARRSRISRSLSSGRPLRAGPVGSIRATRCWRNNQHKTLSRRDLTRVLRTEANGEWPVARMSVQRNPGPAFKLVSRSRISPSLSSGRPLRAGPVGSIRATKEREAERRQTRISNLRTRNLHPSRLRGRTEEGARRASGGTRSPVGVPPRLLLRRPNATAQLRLRASWDAASTGVTRLAPVPVQRAPRRPVIVPAGRIPGAARERSANPPAGTAPAPSSGLPPEGVPSERDSASVTETGTFCQ
jgi:hypothetical protein